MNNNHKGLFIFVNILLLINTIHSQFINVFNVTKAYELRISILDNNGTFEHFDQSFSYFIDDHCSEIYYGEDKNNNSNPVNTKVNVLVYKGAEKNLNFILEINFNTPEYQEFLEGYEIRIIDSSTKYRFSCLRIITTPTKALPINAKSFRLSIKDPKEFPKRNSRYAFFFGRISISSLTYCDHHSSNLPREYCRISNSLINLDAGINSDETNLIHTNTFQNDQIRELYRFNDRSPQVCIKLRKHMKISLGYKYSLAIRLHDSYFVAKSMLINNKYKLSLIHYTCKKSELTSDNKYCLGESIDQHRIDMSEQILADDLSEGLYSIELQPIINTTYCKSQCPYQLNEKSTSLSCEPCQKIISYFQILPSKATNMFHCMNTDEEVIVDERPKLKLETSHLVEQTFAAKYSLKSFKSLKIEINWLQIGVLTALCILIAGILISIIMAAVRFTKHKRKPSESSNRAEIEALNKNNLEDS